MATWKKIRKVLLIEPTYTRHRRFSTDTVRLGVVPPLGLCSIAAVLEREGFEVAIVDCLIEADDLSGFAFDDFVRYGLREEQIRDRIQSFGPDLIGISCLYSNRYRDAHFVARLAKETCPDVPVVMGGTHPTILPERTMKDRNVDYLVLGEGDFTLRDMIARWNKGHEVGVLDGVAFRDGGETVVRPKVNYIEDIDVLPYPARHLIPLKRYSEIRSGHTDARRVPYTTMVTSRGCPAKCTFCSIERLWGPRYRARSAENVLGEIEHLVKDFGIREIHFEDDNLTTQKSRALAIFRGMKERGLDLTWAAPSGIALYCVDDELLEAMHESGCYQFAAPIESGNPHVLRHLINKPLDLTKVPPLVAKARSLGIYTRGFFILGFPGETRQTVAETVDFARDCNLDWSVFFLTTPVPGTRLYQTCLDKGYLIDPDFDLMNLFFESNLRTPEFDAADIERIRDEANIRVNFLENTNLREGKLEQAVTDFTGIVTKYPVHPHGWFGLGRAHAGLGRLDEARKAVRHALELQPDFPAATEMLAKLGEA